MWGFTKRTLILTVILVVAVASILPFLNAWIRQQQEIGRLRDQVAQQERSVEELEVRLERWEDPAYVMAQARERLLYALPGETQYRLTDTSGAEVPQSEDAFVSGSEVSEDWFDAIWSSVQSADDAGPDAAVSEPVEEAPDAPPATSPATGPPATPGTADPEPDAGADPDQEDSE